MSEAGVGKLAMDQGAMHKSRTVSSERSETKKEASVVVQWWAVMVVAEETETTTTKFVRN